MARCIRDARPSGAVSSFNNSDSATEDYNGRYLDFDFYATFNPHKNFGVQAGYRSIDVFYDAKNDTGSLTFKGLYFGGTARF